MLLGDAESLDALVLVVHAAVRRGRLLEAELVGALREQENLHVAFLALPSLADGLAGDLHHLHVLLVARRPRSRGRRELDARKPRGAAVTVQHKLHGIVVVQVRAVRAEEVLDVLNSRAVRQAAELHGRRVELVFLLLALLELGQRLLGAEARGGLGLASAARGHGRGSPLRVACPHVAPRAEQQRDALLAGLAGHLEQLRVLLEPAPQSTLFLHAMPQVPWQQGAQVTQEQRVPLSRSQELHQL
mmetsp:Transcript_35889/g.92381  ORF Transcript_35889/g.92381 Transcript_35889/m.92381 type:complete len:245 (+) Transcript_35889:2241-2975(+)